MPASLLLHGGRRCERACWVSQRAARSQEGGGEDEAEAPEQHCQPHLAHDQIREQCGVSQRGRVAT